MTPADGKSPGFSTARCFSRARTRMIPDTGRSSCSHVFGNGAADAGREAPRAVVYDVNGRTLKAEIVEVPGLAPHWIDEVVEEVYPRRPDR